MDWPWRTSETEADRLIREAAETKALVDARFADHTKRIRQARDAKAAAIEASKPKISPNGKEYDTVKKETHQAHAVKNNSKLGKFIIKNVGGARLLYQIYSVETVFDIYRKGDTEVDAVKRPKKEQPVEPLYWMTPIKILLEEGYFSTQTYPEHKMKKMLDEARNDYTARKVIDKLIATRKITPPKKKKTT